MLPDNSGDLSCMHVIRVEINTELVQKSKTNAINAYTLQYPGHQN